MKKTVKIATWNVNSIRARLLLVTEWLSRNQPDVVLLQEIKCIEEQFPFNDMQALGYNMLIHGQKSYNGVAILSKLPIELTMRNLPMYNSNDDRIDSRYIEAVVHYNGINITVASVYVPTGATDITNKSEIAGSEYFKYKLEFLTRLKQRINEVSKDYSYFVFGGDYNVALEAIDLFNPDTSAGFPGFHPAERSLMYEIIANTNDTLRAMYPDIEQYTWWDYRRNSWNNNKGWRIDYMLTSDMIMKNIKTALVHKNTRELEKPSDHVPVVIEVNID